MDYSTVPPRVSSSLTLALSPAADIADSDQVYTTTLMSGESYEGKTALILGGGDGGLLHELLKQNPKFVTMVEVSVQYLTAWGLDAWCGGGNIDLLDKCQTFRMIFLVDVSR